MPGPKREHVEVLAQNHSDSRIEGCVINVVPGRGGRFEGRRRGIALLLEARGDDGVCMLVCCLYAAE
jgi:hypothetical protein